MGFHLRNAIRLQKSWFSAPTFHEDLVLHKCSVFKTHQVFQVSSLSLQPHVITNSFIGWLFLFCVYVLFASLWHSRGSLHMLNTIFNSFLE